MWLDRDDSLLDHSHSAPIKFNMVVGPLNNGLSLGRPLKRGLADISILHKMNVGSFPRSVSYYVELMREQPGW
jgi:hypothetical protein